MKKPKITAFVLAAVLSSTPVLAAEVPKEAAPINATEESIIITENLISPQPPFIDIFNIYKVSKL